MLNNFWPGCGRYWINKWGGCDPYDYPHNYQRTILATGERDVYPRPFISSKGLLNESGHSHHFSIGYGCTMGYSYDNVRYLRFSYGSGLKRQSDFVERPPIKTREECFKAGVNDHWSKSFDFSDFSDDNFKEPIDVEVQYFDKDKKEINFWTPVDQAFTIVNEKKIILLDVKLRAIRLDEDYFNLVWLGFNRKDELDAWSYVKKEMTQSKSFDFAFQHNHETLTNAATIENIRWNKDFKISDTIAIDFVSVSKTSKGDRLISSGDSSTHDLFVGLEGDDEIIGRRGRDIGFGGDGNDVLRLGNGADKAHGGDGKDLIFGGFGRNTIYNSPDKSKDIIVFKSDGWAANHIYGNTRGNQDGSKIDLIIGADSIDEFRIIYDEEIEVEFTYKDNYHAMIGGQMHHGTAIFLNETLEALVADAGNLSDYKYLKTNDYHSISFSF